MILSTPVTQAQLDNINSQFNLAVKQKNPLRVPRRADLLRDKVIESISCKFKGSPTRLLIDLKTSAGTYVKEFMHSDEGRTVPSLKSLLGQDSVAVESLDVLQIHLDWPERIE